jgi:UDP-N-acetylmuramyl pentapeptide phosphotransferase/UDP-N-acetylglucosamine-1-phosphate transferase
LSISLVISAAGAFGISVICVSASRQWAVKKMLDIPSGRSLHFKPIPRGGGLGIAISVLLGVWVLAILKTTRIPIHDVAALSLGGGMVALVGWLDDMHELSYRIRLGVQMISSATVLVFVDEAATAIFPGLGVIRLWPICALLAVFWVVGMTNAYNFMDGIDGIAGGQALIAGLGWALMGSISGQTFIELVGVILASSSLGFLFFNWPPARLFMGDVGSGFIGFILAVLPIYGAKKTPLLPVVGFLLVWPFIFDTSFTLVRRLIKGDNIFAAHRSHIYQRLVIAGYSHRFVTLLYMGLAVIGTVLALLWYQRAPLIDAAVVVLPLLLFVGLWRFTVSAELRTQLRAQVSVPFN